MAGTEQIMMVMVIFCGDGDNDFFFWLSTCSEINLHFQMLSFNEI